MSFICPQALFLFLFVPIYLTLHFYFEKKNKKDVIPFGNLEVLVEAISKSKKINFLRYLPISLKALALCALLFGLARPVTIILMPMQDTKVMLLMDISISMEAKDIYPDRITVAKNAAIKFVKDLPKGVEVGITLFSGNVRTLVNSTLDKSKTISVLKKLNMNRLEPGTAIGDAILSGVESVTYFDDEKYFKKIKNNRILVLVTDGEANIGADPIFAATNAKANKIIIQAIGIGNPLGTIIRGGILTRLDEITLERVTSLTGGYYSNTRDIKDMNKFYEKIRKEIKLTPKEAEITFIPLVVSLLLLITLQILKWSKFRFS